MLRFGLDQAAVSRRARPVGAPAVAGAVRRSPRPAAGIFLAVLSSTGDIITSMDHQVRIGRKVERGVRTLPPNVQRLLFLLIGDLQAGGPIQKTWRDFSPLGPDRYHCHLNYRYVACWTCRKDSIVIEVYYVGSREKAPY
jgi:hypothetical protein